MSLNSFLLGLADYISHLLQSYCAVYAAFTLHDRCLMKSRYNQALSHTVAAKLQLCVMTHTTHSASW
ncbi:hypothetical protein JOB18_020058 [Solea senegalensis]|uniref:Secreted protein n=1 Tax=Solea senegalensis TaxID=28829 RepID=A0AAV6R2T9_SOLSE|nr:hypothetical protein JOB18_020058 [Solea senegalensis]